MFDKLHEECGVFGIYRRSGEGVVAEAYHALYALQHRGQESCGIAVNDDGVITCQLAREALTLLDVDELGLDRVDRAILTTMMTKFGGRPVGLDTLAATTGEDAVTIEDVYEPYLMQLGFIMRTPRGRICTQAAYDHMHIPMPQEARTAVRPDGQTSLLD